MPRSGKLIFGFALPLGLCLLMLAVAQGGSVSAEDLKPTPTVDRLAEPTIPANPSQADQGSQDYWLYCLPCHGDAGQGLTDEFRALYPPDHQNCWMSGCHGTRPYTDGWTLPTVVPALIGPGALTKFSDAAVVHAFIKSAMPFEMPGKLEDDMYWRITAFLMRQNGYWSGNGEINAENAGSVIVPGAQPAITPTPTVIEYVPEIHARTSAILWTIPVFIAIVLSMIFFRLYKNKDAS